MSGSDPNNRRHPESTFSTEYPYNQATVTRSGHEIHVNDAPGNESLKVAHTAGTYVEIEKSGRWVHTVVEKVYNYFKGTFSQTVDSHADIKIGGTYALNVDKSSYEAVGLDKSLGVGGDLVDGVGGVRQLHTERDKFESINGSFTSSVRGDVNTDVEGAQTTFVNGTRVDTVNNDWKLTSKNVEVYTDGIFKVDCNEFEVNARSTVKINATSTVTITTAAGPITITAGGVVYVNGTQIRLND